MGHTIAVVCYRQTTSILLALTTLITPIFVGDTGAKFGHSPPAVAHAITTQAQKSFTTALPSTPAPDVSAALSEFFGLDCWQLATTATDVNRFVLGCARGDRSQKGIGI